MQATIKSEQQVLQEKALQKRERLEKFAQVFQRANSILALRPINVHIVNDSTGAPAWSGANDVWFNEAKIGEEFDARAILSLQGLDFHELFHVRYTPRNGSAMCQTIIDNNWWNAFNALEDQRIETLGTARFPSTVNWLTATMAQYLLNTPEAITGVFPLVRGRRYLPVEIRRIARQQFRNPELIQDFADVIDEYRTLLFPQDSERGLELVEKYHELLKLMTPNLPDHGMASEPDSVDGKLSDPNGHEQRPFHGHESSDSRPAPKKEQEQDKERSKKIDKEDEQSSSATSDDDEDDFDDEDDSYSDSDDSDSDDDDSDSDRNENSPSDKSDSKDDSDSSSEDSDDDSDSTGGTSDTDFDDVTVADSDSYDEDVFDDSYNPNNGSRHAGVTNSVTANSIEVTETLEDIVDSITEDLSRELDRLSIQINGKPLMTGSNITQVERANYNDVRATEELAMIQRGFTHELQRLKADNDPAWEMETRQGKFKPQRYIQNRPFNVLFDKWREGRDDVTDIEAVILLDRSQSMQGTNAKEAYKSMWAIKRSLDKVNARTTVLTFDYHTRVLYSADEKAEATIRDSGADGGTEPTEAILYAQTVFAETQKPIRLLFMITDGAWNNEKAEDSVRKMREAGVLTCQAIIAERELSADNLNRNRHQFEMVSHIRTAKDILTLGRSLVRTAIARRLVSH